MSDKISIERRILVWDDNLGCRVEIRQDSDGLGLVEIVWFEADEIEPRARMTMGKEMANKFLKAFSEYMGNKENLTP